MLAELTLEENNFIKTKGTKLRQKQSQKKNLNKNKTQKLQHPVTINQTGLSGESPFQWRRLHPTNQVSRVGYFCGNACESKNDAGDPKDSPWRSKALLAPGLPESTPPAATPAHLLLSSQPTELTLADDHQPSRDNFNKNRPRFQELHFTDSWQSTRQRN